MSIQPFRSNERLIIEARNADGSLKFTEPQPPTVLLNCTLDDLYKAMWRDTPDAVGTPEALNAWLRSKSWTLRKRYW